MQLLQRFDGVGNTTALQFYRRHVHIFVLARRENGHRESVIAGGRIAIGFEWLAPRGHINHAIPAHLSSDREHGVEVPAMKWIKSTAADADVHSRPERSEGPPAMAEAGPSPSPRLGMTRFSCRTIEASFRTSSRTPSPTTAETSWYS